MFHFLTKQNYSKYSQISMSMSFSSSEASTMFRSSTASSTSVSVIFSKGLSLFLSSRTDNCDFSCWRPAWQGSFGLKQWILSSSDPSFARFSAHDLNDSTITSFERAAHDSNIHWTIFFCDFLAFLGGGVYSNGGVYSKGSVYFKIRDFRGAFIRGGVYSRRGVYSRKYGTMLMNIL